MNQLSNKLYKAMLAPVAQSVRPSLSNYPSAASCEVTAPDGRQIIVGGCNRQQWYRRKGLTSTEPGNVNWTLSAVQGDYLHTMITNLIEQFGFSMGIRRLAKEHHIYDAAISLSGKSDYLAWDDTLNEPIGIEIKTVGDWKSKKCLEMPADEHIMQSMLYLDYYQKKIPAGQKTVTRWYIWYMARGEGWHLKGAKQLSPFVQLWDFYLTLNDKGEPTVHTPSGPRHLAHLSIPKIRERYKALEEADEKNEIPDRDFQLKHSEEVIAGMFQSDMLELKTHKDIVSRWMKNGAKKGDLELELGDFQCRACSWKSLCWELPVLYTPTEFDLPAKEVEQENEEQEGSMSLL